MLSQAAPKNRLLICCLIYTFRLSDQTRAAPALRHQLQKFEFAPRNFMLSIFTKISNDCQITFFPALRYPLFPKLRLEFAGSYLQRLREPPSLSRRSQRLSCDFCKKD